MSPGPGRPASSRDQSPRFRVAVAVAITASMILAGAFVLSSGLVRDRAGMIQHALPPPPRTEVSPAATTVGPYPVGIAFDPANGSLYVTNHNYPVPESYYCTYATQLGTVTVFSGATRAVLATLVVGAAPVGVAYDPATNQVYVANCGSNNVTIINAITNTLVGSVGVGSAPFGIAYDSTTKLVYVANSGSDNVSVIAGSKVTKTVAVGTDPQFVVYDATHGLVDVTNAGSDNVTAILAGPHGDTLTSVPVGSEPEGIDYNPALGHVYTANFGSENVSVLNGTKVLANLPVGVEPWGVLYDAGTNTVQVTDSGSYNVSILQNDRVVASVEPVSSQPSYDLALLGLAYDPLLGDTFYVDDGTNPGQVLARAGAEGLPGVGLSLGTLSSDPFAGGIDANSFLYLPNGAGSNVTVDVTPGINGASGIYSLAVGHEPRAMAFDPANGELYLTNYGSNNVSVISDVNINDGGGPKVAGAIPVGSSPEAITYDAVNGEIDVANFGGDSVTVISGATNSVVATVPVGIGPSGIAASGGFVYVVNSGSDSMTVIDGSNNTAFATYGTGVNPQAIVIDNGAGYIANLGSDNVTVFSASDPNVASSAAVPAGGTFAGLVAADGYVYESLPSLKEVAVLSEMIAQPSSAAGGMVGWYYDPSGVGPLTYDPWTGTVYIGSPGTSTVGALVVRTNSLEQIVPPSSKPAGYTIDSVVADPANGRLYALQGDALEVYTPWVTAVTKVTIGGTGSPYTEVYDPYNQDIYVGLGGTGLAIVATSNNTLLKAPTVKYSILGLTCNPANGYVYAATGAGDVVVVLSGESVVATLGVGSTSAPRGIAYDPVTNQVYVADYGGTNLTVISGGSVPATVGSVPVGNYPYQLAVNSGTGAVYVASAPVNALFTNLTIVPTSGPPTTLLLPIKAFGSGIAWDNGTRELYVPGASAAIDVVVVLGGPGLNLVRTIALTVPALGPIAWDPDNGDVYFHGPDGGLGILATGD